MHMTVKELIEKLAKFDPDTEVMIFDGSNGYGNPRTINLGPFKYAITENMASDTADCEGKVGDKIIVLGFGCY